ncbi:Glycosyl transferase, family 2 [Pseudomonas caricapapayae]|nr:Glycosyl transferase, family 2 [Pseudomonas caricapapayae]
MPHQTTLVTLTYGDRSSYLHTLISRSLESPLIARVIIVSNASVAPLQALCDEWPDQVQVIRLPHNTGSAFGYATGIKAALEKGDEYIWLMDDDNAPTANAIEVLHRALHERQTIDGSDNCAVLGFRPTHQADIAAGVPLRYAIQRRSSFFGFHIAQLPYKIWRRLPWDSPVRACQCRSGCSYRSPPMEDCWPIAACTRRSACHWTHSSCTATTPSTPGALPTVAGRYR